MHLRPIGDREMDQNCKFRNSSVNIIFMTWNTKLDQNIFTRVYAGHWVNFLKPGKFSKEIIQNLFGLRKTFLHLGPMLEPIFTIPTIEINTLNNITISSAKMFWIHRFWMFLMLLISRFLIFEARRPTFTDKVYQQAALQECSIKITGIIGCFRKLQKTWLTKKIKLYALKIQC